MKGSKKRTWKKDRLFRYFHLSSGSENEDTFHLSLDNLFTGGKVDPTSEYFLGYYTIQGIIETFTRLNIIQSLENQGLAQLKFRIDTSDPFKQKLWVYTGEETSENIVAESVLRKCYVKLDNLPADNLQQPFEIIHIEWLLLQNPRADFSEDRPKLPGQTYPGLRIGRKIIELLIWMARKMEVDGLSNVPNYLHTALIFTREFKFINPETQGMIEAMKRDLLPHHPLYKIAWGMVYEAIYCHHSGDYFSWKPEELVLPLSPKFRQYFNSETYRGVTEKNFRTRSYSIDENKYRQYFDRYGFTELNHHRVSA